MLCRHILKEMKRNVVMQVNASYRISMRTPIGLQSGVLFIAEEGENIRGSIRTMGNTSYFKNGKLKDNTFEFSGILNTGLMRLKYNAKGKITENKLDATVKTDYGVFPLAGMRIES
ncbi:MAG: hypothetical protein E7L17_14115 [Clostridium sp.]|uniref:hypothetical protein n=1 Tax=Clostridium sp. TaxID=1506 RepID=UPI002911BC68|nr:hypothetical protein [Clostridium sp.]MDU7339234.1 hypothetical protein [Clostridium sp.]